MSDPIFQIQVTVNVEKVRQEMTEVVGKVEAVRLDVTAKLGEMKLGQQRLEAMLQTLLSKPDYVVR